MTDSQPQFVLIALSGVLGVLFLCSLQQLYVSSAHRTISLRIALTSALLLELLVIASKFVLLIPAMSVDEAVAHIRIIRLTSRILSWLLLLILSFCIYKIVRSPHSAHNCVRKPWEVRMHAMWFVLSILHILWLLLCLVIDLFVGARVFNFCMLGFHAYVLVGSAVLLTVSCSFYATIRRSTDEVKKASMDNYREYIYGDDSAKDNKAIANSKHAQASSVQSASALSMAEVDRRHPAKMLETLSMAKQANIVTLCLCSFVALLSMVAIVYHSRATPSEFRLDAFYYAFCLLFYAAAIANKWNGNRRRERPRTSIVNELKRRTSRISRLSKAPTQAQSLTMTKTRAKALAKKKKMARPQTPRVVKQAPIGPKTKNNHEGAPTMAMTAMTTIDMDCAFPDTDEVEVQKEDEAEDLMTPEPADLAEAQHENNEISRSASSSICIPELDDLKAAPDDEDEEDVMEMELNTPSNTLTMTPGDTSPGTGMRSCTRTDTATKLELQISLTGINDEGRVIGRRGAVKPRKRRKIRFNDTVKESFRSETPPIAEYEDFQTTQRLTKLDKLADITPRDVTPNAATPHITPGQAMDQFAPQHVHNADGSVGHTPVPETKTDAEDSMHADVLQLIDASDIDGKLDTVVFELDKVLCTKRQENGKTSRDKGSHAPRPRSRDKKKLCFGGESRLECLRRFLKSIHTSEVVDVKCFVLCGTTSSKAALRLLQDVHLLRYFVSAQPENRQKLVSHVIGVDHHFAKECDSKSHLILLKLLASLKRSHAGMLFIGNQKEVVSHLNAIKLCKTHLVDTDGLTETEMKEIQNKYFFPPPRPTPTAL